MQTHTLAVLLCKSQDWRCREGIPPNEPTDRLNYTKKPYRRRQEHLGDKAYRGPELARPPSLLAPQKKAMHHAGKIEKLQMYVRRCGQLQNIYVHTTKKPLCVWRRAERIRLGKKSRKIKGAADSFIAVRLLTVNIQPLEHRN